TPARCQHRRGPPGAPRRTAPCSVPINALTFRELACSFSRLFPSQALGESEVGEGVEHGHAARCTEQFVSGREGAPCAVTYCSVLPAPGGGSPGASESGPTLPGSAGAPTGGAAEPRAPRHHPPAHPAVRAHHGAGPRAAGGERLSGEPARRLHERIRQRRTIAGARPRARPDPGG